MKSPSPNWRRGLGCELWVKHCLLVRLATTGQLVRLFDEEDGWPDQLSLVELSLDHHVLWHRLEDQGLNRHCFLQAHEVAVRPLAPSPSRVQGVEEQRPCFLVEGPKGITALDLESRSPVNISTFPGLSANS